MLVSSIVGIGTYGVRQTNVDSHNQAAISKVMKEYRHKCIYRL